MSVAASKIIYDIARKHDLVNSGRITDYRIVDIVSFANEAYETIIEYLIANKDENNQIRNHLRPLIVPNICLNCIKTDEEGVCKIKYPSDYYDLIKLRVTVSKDCCEGNKKFTIPKPQADDFEDARSNDYRKANYYFEQLLSYDDNDGLRIYHDNEMDIDKICIDYYKKITRIEAPNLVGNKNNIYKKWDGSLIKDNVDFENDSTYINNKISDVAVYKMGVASKEYPFSQSKLSEIISINKIL